MMTGWVDVVFDAVVDFDGAVDVSATFVVNVSDSCSRRVNHSGGAHVHGAVYGCDHGNVNGNGNGKVNEEIFQPFNMAVARY